MKIQGVTQETTYYNYLKLGNSMTDHFVIEVCTAKKIGRMMLINRNDLVKHRYDLDAEAIEVMIKFLKLIQTQNKELLRYKR
jgi:hypothetical protein